MKKIMGLVLGLTLVLGTTSLFGQDTTTTTTKTKKHKSHKSKKSTDTSAMGTEGGATK